MICDRCGNLVEPQDDAVALSALCLNEPVYNLIFGTRHIRCSPSRAQYIVHPQFAAIADDRPEYDKRLKDPALVALWEERWTGAWIALRQ